MKGFCFIGLALAISVSTVTANICSGHKNGDHIPNTADCGSYYVCDYSTPSLFECGGGLLYDEKLGVCNWAHSVSCGQIGQSPSQKPTVGGPPADRPPTQAPPALYPPTQRPNTNPNQNWPSQSWDNSVDYYPGIKENKNNPLGYSCTIDGFYFAPHPYSCEQYFICENRRVHLHQCGAGIHWDYIYLQCDFPERSYCYSNSTQHHNNNNPPAYLPVSGSPPIFVGVTAPVGILIETVPTGEETTATTEESTTEVEVTEAEVTEESFVCPADQSFMAHTDCHRYYICITGLAIPISCPDSMAWDDSIMQCTEEALVTCES